MDKANKDVLKDFREQCTIYVVGDEASRKTNQWWAMTNDMEQVKKLMSELGATTYKKVFVKPKEAS